MNLPDFTLWSGTLARAPHPAPPEHEASLLWSVFELYCGTASRQLNRVPGATFPVPAGGVPQLSLSPLVTFTNNTALELRLLMGEVGVRVTRYGMVMMVWFKAGLGIFLWPY